MQRDRDVVKATGVDLYTAKKRSFDAVFKSNLQSTIFGAAIIGFQH